MLCAKVLEMEPDDVVLHAAPMFHMADSCLGGAASWSARPTPMCRGSSRRR
uniref:Uncharacterized protein n=1 Tax=Phenylobacterium glaciei TaxID=2803784 RepID=A0A974P1I2_9CAUL|nr:hypothetical protein JKL49_19080 [Phenylobacterium glaciei]